MAEKAVSLDRLKRFKTKNDSRYALKNHGNHMPDYCTTISNWDNATKCGWYICGSSSSAPNPYKNYIGRVIAAGSSSYIYQEIWDAGSGSGIAQMVHYVRAKSGTGASWSAWTDVTVCKAVPADAKFTDTNTWRGIQNVLTSTSTTESLSAAQGKALNDRLKVLESWKTSVLAGTTPVFIVDATSTASVSTASLPSADVMPEVSIKALETTETKKQVELPDLTVAPA